MAELRQRRSAATANNPENDLPHEESLSATAATENNDELPPAPLSIDTPVVSRHDSAERSQSGEQVQQAESSKTKIARRVLYGFGMFSVFCGSVSRAEMMI